MRMRGIVHVCEYWPLTLIGFGKAEHILEHLVKVMLGGRKYVFNYMDSDAETFQPVQQLLGQDELPPTQRYHHLWG